MSVNANTINSSPIRTSPSNNGFLPNASVSQRTAAIVTGVSLLIMTLAAGFSYGFVYTSLVVEGDAAATTANIVASNTLFRLGLTGWIVILLMDIVVAWALYIVLKPVNQALSLLTAWLRLVYTAILGVGLLNFVFVLLLTSGDASITTLPADQSAALVMLYLNAFNGIWGIGLVVFGCHLLLLGYVVLMSDAIPKILGVLLVIAALAYLIVHLGNLLLPGYEQSIVMVETVLTLPMIIGEVGFGLWLLIRGGKKPDAQLQELPA